MKTGIIGAGRVGCSLGKYFRSKNADLVGYYDTNTAAAEEAAAPQEQPVEEQKQDASQTIAEADLPDAGTDTELMHSQDKATLDDYWNEQ